MKRPLDATDTRLLALLRADARTSVVTLAKKVDLSRTAVQERLDRLEAAGVIAGYTVQLGASAETNHHAWLLLRYHPGTLCANLVPRLQQWPEVRLCHSLAGSVDMLLRIEAESPARLAELRAAVAALPGVAEVTTAPVLKAHFG